MGMKSGQVDRLRQRLRAAEAREEQLEAQVEELERELEDARQAAHAAGQDAWNHLSDAERSARIRNAARMA
jgi:uncharacterized protein YlxW (UPF0749 family)